GFRSGSFPRRSVEGACLNAANNHRAHHDQVSKQFQRAALFWRGSIVELLAVDFACQMEQNSNFVLQGSDQFILCQYHCCKPPVRSLVKKWGNEGTVPSFPNYRKAPIGFEPM